MYSVDPCLASLNIILISFLIVIFDSGRRFSKQKHIIPSSTRSDHMIYNTHYGMAGGKLSDNQISSDGSRHVSNKVMYTTSGEEVNFENGAVYEEPKSVLAITTSPNRSYESLHSNTRGSKKVQNGTCSSSYDHLHHNNGPRLQPRDMIKPALLSANDQLCYEGLRT